MNKKRFASLIKRTWDDKDPIRIEADTLAELRTKERAALKKWQEEGGMNQVLAMILK